MKRLFGLALAVLALTIGCHSSGGQIPPPSTGDNANLSWTAPTSGCAPSCSYIIYRETLASGTTCDPTTSTNWKQLATATALSYVDQAAGGQDVCYGVVAVSNSLNGPNSNLVNVTVPGPPTAPALNPPTTSAQAAENLPLDKNHTLFTGDPTRVSAQIHLTVTVTRRRG